jgi:3-hydroxyisobutyrate dehydrogenase
MPTDHNTAIAFLGMGLMGSRMSARLIAAGFKVAVWNRSAEACQPLLAAGAATLELPQIGHYPIIMLCLADDAAVEAVYRRLAPNLQAGQIIIDFSSVSVSCTQQLAQAAAEQQVLWLDAPVSGGIRGAEDGSLVIFAGGEATQIKALAPVFAPLAQRVTRMGAVGSGQATKICNQLIVSASSILIAEAVALAEKSGVDSALLAPALAGGFADSKPFQILAPRMATQCFVPVQWKVQTLSKDLANALQLATNLQLDIPLAGHAFSQLQQHQQHGFAEQDLSTLILNVKAKI